MADETQIQHARNQIKTDLRRLASKLCEGDDTQLLVWVIPSELAVAHRPLRYHPQFCGSGCDLPPEATSEVVRWVDRIFDDGIRSVICLMHPKEIRHYAELDLGASDILELYRQHGLEVCHIPWDDPAHRPRGEQASFREELLRVRIEALECFDRLTKPVLIHCSAGQDRSSPVAAYIVTREREIADEYEGRGPM